MKATVLAVLSTCIGLSLLAPAIPAKPLQLQELASEPQVDRAGRADLEAIQPSKVLGDTVWIADWTFDDGASCDDTGWVRYDNRILHDGSNYWSVNASFSGFGAITGQAAVLAKHDLNWVRDGYGNEWDYSIILKYQGASTLSFDYLSDSEPSYDFVTVEADSAGASESRVDYATAPADGPAAYRSQLMSVSGSQAAIVGGLVLPDFAVPATIHEAYIRFASDSGYSDEDGQYPTTWNAGLVVDNIVVTGSLAYSENFEGALNPNVTLANTAPSVPFGEWARLYSHITDNDLCSENTTCAWLWSDPSLPALFSDMAFGPGAFVVRNWLDDVIVSPWVNASGLAGPGVPVLAYRRFPGNDYGKSRIVQNWSIRAKLRIDNTDTSTLGDSIDAVTPWRHVSNWSALSTFRWESRIADLTSYLDPGALEVQVRFRVSDWQYIAGIAPPSTLDPGPGPFLDRVRIGRMPYTGPTFAGAPLHYASQDGFPSARTGGGLPEDFVPTNDRFGTVDFAAASVDVWQTSVSSPYYYDTRDSILVTVLDVREVGITSVGVYAAIASGPHAGKAPPPWSVGSNGFFNVPADSARNWSGVVVPEHWFVDLDDEYFRGGDVLVYFWAATDAAGGFSSFPEGLSAVPTSVTQAQEATGGLFEVGYLPTIDWDPGYLARVAAHPTGKIDPTPEEIAGSHQRSCILYYVQQQPARRSGSAHRTAFMTTLDQLGYADLYDVYSQTTYWITASTHLAGRASPEQATGYALVIHDAGHGGGHLIPPGGLHEAAIDQQTWYRDWLAQAAASEAGRATLWFVGENFGLEATYYGGPYPPLYIDMGVTFVSQSQSLTPSPEIAGLVPFTWAHGGSTDFTGDLVTLDAPACDAHENDGLAATGSAVVTHRYTQGATTGDGAAVMNANPAASWNSILTSFAWEDLIDVPGSPPGYPRADLMAKVLTGVLPDSCQSAAVPTGVPDDVAVVPRLTVLHPNVPNPFNPTTTIRFDLARNGHVRLRIYDVAGRVVGTLVDGPMTAGFGKRVLWNGLDASGQRAPSGVYFSQLVAADLTATRKMVLLQ